MRQARAQMIARSVQENLGLVFQPAEGTGVNDPCSITLKFHAISMTWLRKFSATRIAGFLRERCEHASLIGLHLLTTFPAAARNRSRREFRAHIGIIRCLVRLASLEFQFGKAFRARFFALSAPLFSALANRKRTVKGPPA